MSLLVGVGLLGAAGAVLRALATRANRPLPWGTFAVNLVAAFALGWLHGRTGWWADAAGIGLLGALSTWSTVAAEVSLIRPRPLAAAYLGLTVVSVVAAAWLGLRSG